MTPIQGLILGLIQGIAEWLPVSSEGMTSLVMINFFGKELTEAIPIALWLHIGTLAAALVYFREEIWRILMNLPSYRPRSKSETNRLTTFIITATVFTGLVGVPLYLIGLEKFTLTGKMATAFIGALLIVTGVLMKFARRKVEERDKETSGDGLLAGIAQGFAVLPGISRSGFTASVLLLRRFEPEKALKMSFIISIPAVIGAQVLLKMDEAIMITPTMILAALTSFIVGYLTIDILLRAGRRIDFSYFVILIGLLSLSVIFI